MANVKKALYNVAVFLVSLFITGSINVSNIKSTQDTSRVTLTVNETETLQEMNGWGAPPRHGGRRSQEEAKTPTISQSFSTAKRDSG